MLSADKPFLMKALGRKNMNFDYFSHSCTCADKDLYTLDFDALTHYDGISFEKRCAWALVPLHEALDLKEPAEWSVTDARGKTFSKAEVLKLRADVDAMGKAARESFLEQWAKDNYGQNFGCFPVLPYHDVCIDYLHAYINEFNAALHEALHRHLDPEQYSDEEIKEMAERIRGEVNAYLKVVNINLTFGVENKRHAANG